MEVDECGSKRSLDGGVEEAVDKKAKVVNCFSTDLLKLYYQMRFPYVEMFKWLCYGNDPEKDGEMVDREFINRREFSFNINGDKGEIYIRYLCFKNFEEFKAGIQKKQPHKIDIGAVYTIPPKNQNTLKSAHFKPVERELVFDIDLTDYDEVRTGCTPDMMWEKGSWSYMSVAIKVIDQALRQDFGFEHLFWVFSGRRGVHCWVCDASARALEDKERTAIVRYLTLISGNDNSGNRVPLSSPLHPSIQRALPMLEAVFNEMVLSPEGQDLLKDEPRWERVLKMIPDEDIQERLRSMWKHDKTNSSPKRWKQLRATVLDKAQKLKARGGLQLKRCLNQIIILHTYARLDVNVSTHRNHLLKSPFVIHPKTGKVCVPILDVENCHKFDPDGVPTLVTLIEEMEENTQTNSLEKYVQGFDKKFLTPLYKSIRKEIKQKAEATGEW